jgi:TRAP transporter TAXI family solute receptor
MKRSFFILLSLLLVVLGVIGCSKAGNGQGKSETLKYSIGAASAGGGFHTGATALSSVLNEKMPNMETVVEVTGASMDNVQLLQAGEVEIGLSSTEVAWEAYNGQYSFEGKPHDKLRTLIPGWPGVYMFVTLEETGINSIHDLEGKKYSSGPKGSANEVFADRVFKTFDIKPDVLNLPTSDAANALKDGTIDGFSIAWPSSAVTELEISHKVKIITLNEDQRQKFLESNPPYVWLEIPPEVYKAVPNGAENFGLYNLFLVSSDVSEETVYNMVKAVYENKDIIKQVWPNMVGGMAFENLGKTTIPYHPGAVKYFKEQGAKVPEELLPPENK